MGGIGLSSTEPQPNTTHTYAHTHTHKIHTYEIIHLNNIYMHKNTTQQYPDTEQTQPQHRCITYDLHKYSFDFYHEYAFINKSYTKVVRGSKR